MFTLVVPSIMPDAARDLGASALPLDRFAFAREWLDHYRGQCIGKEGINVLGKGLQQAILSRGYITTRVLLPAQDMSDGAMASHSSPARFAASACRTRSWGTWKNAFPLAPAKS